MSHPKRGGGTVISHPKEGKREEGGSTNDNQGEGADYVNEYAKWVLYY